MMMTVKLAESERIKLLQLLQAAQEANPRLINQGEWWTLERIACKLRDTAR